MVIVKISYFPKIKYSPNVKLINVSINSLISDDISFENNSYYSPEIKEYISDICKVQSQYCIDLFKNNLGK